MRITYYQFLCNKLKLEDSNPSSFDYDNQRILIQTEITENDN